MLKNPIEAKTTPIKTRTHTSRARTPPQLRSTAPSSNTTNPVPHTPRLIHPTSTPSTVANRRSSPEPLNRLHSLSVAKQAAGWVTRFSATATSRSLRSARSLLAASISSAPKNHSGRK